MKVLIAFGVVLGLVIGPMLGCGGGDVCQQAADKLKSCGSAGSMVVVSGECDPRSACESECINQASCAEITAAFTGTPNSYSACDDNCN